MAETRTTRMGMPQWSDGAADAPSREDFNEAFQRIEERTARFGQGTRAARPNAGVLGRFYVVVGDTNASNNGQCFYDTGTAWISIGAVVQSSSGNAVTSPDAATVALTVTGAANQTANLQQWKDSTGKVVAYVTKDGTAFFSGLSYGGSSDFDQIVVQNLAKFVTAIEAQTARILGTLTATEFKSTTNRIDGTPKTILNGNGTGRVDAVVPPGSMVMWATSTPPEGWLLCNGQSLQRSAYPDLFDVIGVTYGSVSSTEFNLPDCRSRYLMGAGTRQVGTTDGLAESSRIAALNHSHTHSIGTYSFSHSHTTSSSGGGSYTTSTAGDHGHSVTVSSAGDHTHSISSTSLNSTNNTQISASASSLRLIQETHSHTAGTAGSHSHTASAGNNGSHSHSVTVNAHDHTVSSVTDTHNHGGSTGTGGGSEHPYIALNFIIRT